MLVDLLAAGIPSSLPQVDSIVLRMDVLAGNWRRRREVPVVDAELDLVVEDADGDFCGAVVGYEADAVVLEDRRGRRRVFPLLPAAFLLDGEVVSLRRPVSAPTPAPRGRT